MEPGTGKTRIAVELINDIPSVDYVLWIGPFQTIHRPEGVQAEVAKWGGFVAPVDFVGIESIQSSDRIYLTYLRKLQQHHNAAIIVDESLKIKNANAKRTNRLLTYAGHSMYRLVLNGTPLSRNLLDLWSQLQFLSPQILNMDMAEFKDTFCKYTTVTKHFGNSYRAYTKEFITGYENIDYLYSLIRHYVYECDLSLQIRQYYNVLPYRLDADSSEEYYCLKEHYLDNETLLWKNNNIFLEMTQKMQHTYSCTPEKFDVVDNLFQSIAPVDTIIFCKYVDSREACSRYWPKATVLSYQKESLGLNMQHIANTIYFDKIWDYALRVQSGRRTFRTGQELDCRYWDLTGNVGLEKLIDKNIEKKIGMVEYFKGKTKQELKEVL
jgi:SNF2 family DNA or RNA helicase